MNHTIETEHPVAAIVREAFAREQILWNSSSTAWTMEQSVLVDMLKAAYESGKNHDVDALRDVPSSEQPSAS
jgi:hypothetical protein